MVSYILPTEGKTFVSLSPALTEIMYAIGAESQLIGVSTECNYPKRVISKERIGNYYFLNEEKLIELNPDYLLIQDWAKGESSYTFVGIKPLVFNIRTIDEIYAAIIKIGVLTDHIENAHRVIQDLKRDIAKSKAKRAKRVLYLCQISPMITIGNKSFIADIIKESGQKLVTEELNAFYPTVSEEYILRTKPEIIVVSNGNQRKKIEKLFPKAKIIYLEKWQNDIINRTSPRVNEAVKFFAEL
jgi:iron complex transport system substrate-binding protein